MVEERRHRARAMMRQRGELRATTLRGPHWADATQVGRILPRELGIRDAQAGESRMTPPASSSSSQVRPRISFLRQPGRGASRHLSTDHDPLFEAHRWTANLRILETLEL